MIISHKHRFIFIHLSHTSGRSITMDLLPYCGEDDIITPTGNFPGQNCQGWKRHEAGRNIKKKIGQDIWGSYFKFAMERNPWDKVVSNYWYKRGYKHNEILKAEKKSPPVRFIRAITGYPWSLDAWLKYRHFKEKFTNFERPRLPRGSYWYLDNNGKFIIDALLRYEHRAAHLAEISKKLGLDIAPKAEQGRQTRKAAADYTAEYSDWSRDYIENYFAADQALLKYEFAKPAPDNLIWNQT